MRAPHRRGAEAPLPAADPSDRVQLSRRHSGRWRGSQHSFVARFRSGFAHNRGDEFDAPFVRLDHREEDLAATRFDVMWHRHTGRWWLTRSAVTLEEALHLIETDPVLRPPI
jgi:hypothetical protein